MTTYTAAANIFPLKISENINVRPSTLIEYQAVYKIPKGAPVPSTLQLGSQIQISTGIVYVFPGPQLSSSSNDPWDTITLTAYGDGLGVNSRAIYGASIIEVSKSFSETHDEKNYNWTIYESWSVNTATAIRAISSSSSALPSVINPPIPLLRKRRIIGAVVPGGDQTLTVVWTLADIDISRTNFGMVDEVSLTKGYLPTVS